MSSIPLPALDIRPPQQQESPLDSYAKVLQMKGLMAQQQMIPGQLQEQQQRLQQGQMQNQMTQMDVQARQLFGQALQQSGGDYEKAFGIAEKNGANPVSLMPLKGQIVEYKQKLLGYTKEQQDFARSQSDLIQGAYDKVNQAAPQDKAQVYAQQIAQLKQVGVQGTEQMPAQYPGDEAFAQVGTSLRAHSQLQEDAFKQAETQKNVSQTREANASASQKEQETQMGGTQQFADAKYRFIQQAMAAKQPISPQDQNFVAAYEKQKKLVPMSVAQVRLQGMGTMRQFPVFDSKTKQTVYMDSNEINDAKLKEPGRFTVPSYTPEAEIEKQTGKTFGPGGKGSEEVLAFNTALQHADLLQKASDALKNGDVRALNSAGNALGVQFGSDKKTNFQVIANAYTREVTKALSAGHLTDSEISQQGATMPANASPEQISGALGAYKSLMASKVKLRQQQFEQGKQGQPNFGSQNTQQHAPGAQANLPEGTTGKGSDNKPYIVKDGVWVPQQ